MKIKKDYFGQVLEVGDTVAFMHRNYRHFITGTITSMSAQQILIEHPMTNVCSAETRQYPGQVFKKIIQ